MVSFCWEMVFYIRVLAKCLTQFFTTSQQLAHLKLLVVLLASLLLAFHILQVASPEKLLLLF